MRQFTLKGANAEEKLDHAEIILNRVMRKRQLPQVCMVTPPVIMSTFTAKPEVEGTLGKFFIPVEGDVTTISIFCEMMEPKSKPALQITLIDPSGSSITALVPYKEGLTLIEKKIPIVAGTRIVTLTTQYESVSGLWVGILFIPEVGRGKKEQILISTVKELADASTTEE
jgi:hypothetical protein